jgi:hypothetical protein
MADEKNTLSPKPAAHPGAGTNGAAPGSVPASKKFPHDVKNEKRGPGRPPKNSALRGSPPATAGAERARETAAAAPAPSTYTAKPASEPGFAGVRGLFQMAAGISAGISWGVLGIDYFTALKTWQFSEAELLQLEKPGAPFLDKYAPLLDDYGIELEFAGALLPILSGKIFAIIALKRKLDAEKKLPPAAGSPSRSASVTEIRPATNAEAREPAAAASPQPTMHADESRATADSLPSAFEHNQVDTKAELVTL